MCDCSGHTDLIVKFGLNLKFKKFNIYIFSSDGVPSKVYILHFSDLLFSLNLPMVSILHVGVLGLVIVRHRVMK